MACINTSIMMSSKVEINILAGFTAITQFHEKLLTRNLRSCTESWRAYHPPLIANVEVPE